MASLPLGDCGVTEDELRDLMEEPPGGHSHGKRRGPRGAWVSLDDKEQGALSDGFWIEPDPKPYIRVKRPEETIRHGTVAAYNHQRCRCLPCRKAVADYRKKRRNVQPG